jgi:hypothetical protein
LDEISTSIKVGEFQNAVQILLSDHDLSTQKMREKLMKKLVQISAEDFRKKGDYQNEF